MVLSAPLLKEPVGTARWAAVGTAYLGVASAGGPLASLSPEPATAALAPVEHTGLVWAGVYGYAVWADVPGPGTCAGAALIVAGSLGLVWSESRARQER